MNSWNELVILVLLASCAACSGGAGTATGPAPAGTARSAKAGPAEAAPNVKVPAYSADRAFEHLRYLAGTVGIRSAGSAGDEKGAAYIAQTFKSYGLDTRVEQFPIPVWHEKKASLTIEEDKPIVLAARTVAFTGVTPDSGVSGEFVDLFDASPRYTAGRDLKGKIALIKRDVVEDYPDYWLTDRLIPLGVSGMIFYSATNVGGIPVAYFNFKRSLKEKTPPSVVVTYEDALRLVKQHPKRVTLLATGEVENSETRNVIGELKGTTKPDEIVIVSGHHDTVYGSEAATDDTGAVAIVLELARVFAAGPRPARTIQFIAFGAEEPGLMGSEAYLRAHPDVPAKMIAMVNYEVWGNPLGNIRLTANGPDAWLSFVRVTLKQTGLDRQAPSGPSGADVTNFGSLEVPTIELSGEAGPGLHTAKDDLSYCDPVGLEQGLLVGATLVARLGFEPSLAFPHQFPPALLQEIRDYAARWGWGVRPEANLPPRQN